MRHFIIAVNLCVGLAIIEMVFDVQNQDPKHPRFFQLGQRLIIHANDLGTNVALSIRCI